MMICPKCKSDNQFDRFCGHCGNQLKEPCPEPNCGQWESIGRLVCKTALAEAKNVREKYSSKKKVLLSLLLVGLLVFIFVIGGSFFSLTTSRYSYVLSLICGIISLVIFLSMLLISPIRQGKRRKDFMEKFPHEAEIIRRAKGGGE